MTAKKKKQRHRSLALVFALFTFSILVVSLLLTVGVVYLSAFALHDSAPFSALSLPNTLQILILTAVDCGHRAICPGGAHSPQAHQLAH